MNLYYFAGLWLSAFLVLTLLEDLANWLIGLVEGTEKHDDDE